MARRAAPRVDPVTSEIILGAFETICYEMATHVSLSATTPILNQSNERNATILDGRGALAALSVGIPQFMLSSTLPVRFALDFFGPDGFADGDVLVANDPYHGGGHLPDYNVFAPVVVDGEVVLIASIQCHHADTGGGMPGGYNAEALDIWAEGVRFPAVKVIERGRERLAQERVQVRVCGPAVARHARHRRRDSDVSPARRIRSTCAAPSPSAGPRR